MSRIPKIPKELILEASLDLLISEDYSNITIKNIAKKLNCSTQPISWHFGSMPALRESLLDYALQYVQESYLIPTVNPFYSFYLTGRNHIDMALKMPHLFRFLYMGEGGMQFNEEYSSSKYSTSQMAQYLGISVSKAAELIQTMLFYTQGASSMIVTHAINETPDSIFEAFDHVSVKLLVSYGIEFETAVGLIKNPVNVSSNIPT